MFMKRKGFNSIKNIPKEIKEQLNLGVIESITLSEWLSVNQIFLLKSFLKENNRITYIDKIDNNLNYSDSSIVLNKRIGRFLYEMSIVNCDSDILDLLTNHISDRVRCWAISFILSENNLNIKDILDRIKIFANDDNFNVREFVWLSVRDYVINDLNNSLYLLKDWTKDPSPYIRRFASEVTRPIGVWSRHIEKLKTNPSLALHILEPLKSDTSRYVQNSVANWLNDVNKNNPRFVADLVNRWREESKTKETEYIAKRATRTLRKIPFYTDFNGK